MNKIDLILTKLIRIFQVLMVIASIIMVVTMFAQVVLRYIFHTGFPWTEELSRFVMIYLVFIGSIVLTREDSHISVTIFDEILKGTSYKLLKCVQYLITAIYCVLMARIGFLTLPIVKMQTSPNMMIRMNYIYMIMPLCFTFMLIYILYNIFKLFDKSTEMGGK